MADEKKKVLSIDESIKILEKKFGKGSVVNFSKVDKNVRVISSGIPSLDTALGVGGWPRGRMVELFGPEGCGKTSIMLKSVATAQKTIKKAQVGYIDAENALDPTYAENIGINLKKMMISQPDTGEQGLAIMEWMVQQEYDIIAIDSVASLVPTAELEGKMGDSHVGLQARMMSQALRKTSTIARKSGTVIIFINQLRDVIGAGPFAAKQTTPGGRALKHYASTRLQVWKASPWLKNGDLKVGQNIGVKIVKNKVAPPYKESKIPLVWGEGVSAEMDIIRMALSTGIFDKSGAWISYKGEKIGQGELRTAEVLQNNSELFNEVSASVSKLVAEACKK